MADKAVSKLTQVVNHAAIGNCLMVSQKGLGASSTNSSLISALQIPYASLVNAYAGGSNAFGVKTVSSDRITPAVQTIHDMWYDTYPRAWTVTDSSIHVIDQSTNAFIKAAAMYVKQAGAWTPVKEAWIKDAGTWKQILATVPAPVTVSASITVIGGGGSGGSGANGRGFRKICGGSGGSAGAAGVTITVNKGTSYAVAVAGAGGTSSFASSLIYATGGGNGRNGLGVAGANGSWGGSAAGIYAGSLISPYGGGGGGGCGQGVGGGGGQAGVVIIRVPSTTAATATGGVSSSIAGSERVYTFTGAGSIAFA